MGVEIVDVESILKKIPFDTIKGFYLDVEKASSRHGNLTNGYRLLLKTENTVAK